VQRAGDLAADPAGGAEDEGGSLGAQGEFSFDFPVTRN
jgi:hypothetical protein